MRSLNRAQRSSPVSKRPNESVSFAEKDGSDRVGQSVSLSLSISIYLGPPGVLLPEDREKETHRIIRAVVCLLVALLEEALHDGVLEYGERHCLERHFGARGAVARAWAILGHPVDPLCVCGEDALLGCGKEQGQQGGHDGQRAWEYHGGRIRVLRMWGPRLGERADCWVFIVALGRTLAGCLDVGL